MKTITLTPKDTKGLDLAGMPCKDEEGTESIFCYVDGKGTFQVEQGSDYGEVVWAEYIQVEESVFIDYALRSLRPMYPRKYKPTFATAYANKVKLHGRDFVWSVKNQFLAGLIAKRKFRFVDGRFEVVA